MSSSILTLAYLVLQMPGTDKLGTWIMWLVTVVLPVVGVFVLVFSLRRANQFPTNPEIFNWKEVHVEVTVLTEYLMGGLALCLVGVVLFVILFLHDFEGVQKQLDGAKGAIEAERHFSIDLHMTFVPGPGHGQADISSLKCSYQFADEQGWASEFVFRGKSPNEVVCPLRDITRGKVIQELRLENITTQKIVGQKFNVYPLQPAIALDQP